VQGLNIMQFGMTFTFMLGKAATKNKKQKNPESFRRPNRRWSTALLHKFVN
jgi:hypothetical protein